MLKKCLFFSILIVFIGFAASAQLLDNLTLAVIPGINIPVGSSADRYTIGGGAELKGEYKFPSLPYIPLLLSINYNMFPTEAQSNVNTLSIGAGTGLKYSPVKNLDAKLYAEGGGFIAFFESRYSMNPYFQISGNVSYNIVPFFSIGAGAGYKHYFASPEPFFHGVGASIYAAFHLGAKRERRPRINIEEIEIFPVFPVFFKYYDEHPLGRIVVQNNEKGKIRDVKVSLFVKQYMEKPTQSISIKEMKEGEEKEIPLYALFSDTVLNITEKTKVQTDITVEYTFNNDKMTLSQVETMRMYDRNAITWDDNRKVAAFVTAREPAVLLFSKKVSGLVRDSGAKSIDKNLLIAMGLHEALSLYGMKYVPDPSTPYIEYSQNASAVDFVQFPNQTLQYKAGDCDDLSILYNALLESVGVETAFITSPGHIYIAFAVDTPPRMVSRHFTRPDDFIIMDEKVWVPVEVTSIDDGFLRAWQLGVQDWREFYPKGESDFYPTRSSWKVYEAVGFQAPEVQTVLPDENEVIERFNSEKQKYVNREIRPKVEALQERIRKTGGDPKYINLLGALYAEYGMYSEAEQQFRAVIDSDHYWPAIANLGNIYYLKGDTRRALDYYREALKIKPDDTFLSLSAALAYYDLEIFDEARKYYEKVMQSDPDLAAKYEYIESSGSMD